MPFPLSPSKASFQSYPLSAGGALYPSCYPVNAVWSAFWAEAHGREGWFPWSRGLDGWPVAQEDASGGTDLIGVPSGCASVKGSAGWVLGWNGIGRVGSCSMSKVMGGLVAGMAIGFAC